MKIIMSDSMHYKKIWAQEKSSDKPGKTMKYEAVKYEVINNSWNILTNFPGSSFM